MFFPSMGEGENSDRHIDLKNSQDEDSIAEDTKRISS